MLLGIAALPSFFTLNYKGGNFGAILSGALLAAVTIVLVLGFFGIDSIGHAHSFCLNAYFNLYIQSEFLNGRTTIGKSR